MGYLFDRSLRISHDDNTKTPITDNHAVYVMEPAARMAAAAIFSEMDSQQLIRFAFLPFPRICMEWRHEDEQVCVLLEDSIATNKAQNQEFASVTVAILVENSAGRQWQSALYFVRTVNENDSIPWAQAPAGKDIPQSHRMTSEAERNLISEIIVQLALLNAPNLRVGERRDQIKLNKARAKNGKAPLAAYTVIRPTVETGEWVRAQSAVDRAPAMEHWVKGHFKTYWTGPKADQQKPLIKLLAPFKRGNPERGEKSQRYIVT